MRSVTIQLVTLAMIFLPALGAVAQEEGNPGTVKIDDRPFESEADNDPKTNCVFQIDFFGFQEQTAVVTFAAQPPTGTEQLFTTEVALTTAESGEELSGSVTVDLTDELEAFDPAQADFDYKVDLTVETVNNDNSADTKNGIFFLTCETAAAGDAAEDEAADAGEATTPEGAAATGAGGSASSSAAVYLITGAALLGAAAILGRKRLGL